jgi:hypothetical protein
LSIVSTELTHFS